MTNTRMIACGITAAVLAGAAAAAPAALARTPALALPASSQPPSARQLTDSAVPFTAQGARALVAGPRRLTLQVWLTPRTSAAQSYANAASTPGSACRTRATPSGTAADVSRRPVCTSPMVSGTVGDFH